MFDKIEKNLEKTISNNPKKIPIIIDKANTIIVNLVASCLDGQVTFLSSPITSEKNATGANPFFVILGGWVDNFISFL